MASYSQTQKNFFSSSNPEFPLSSGARNNQRNKKLWQPSQTSLNFVSPRISFSRQQRFNLHSIYYPQNNASQAQSLRINKQRSEIDSIAKQISKRIDEQQKNQLRIKKKFSQHQKRITLLFNDNAQRKHQFAKEEMNRFMLNKKNQQITQRLASQSPKRQSLLRDRHGIRSNLVLGEDEHLHQVVKDQIQTMTQSSWSSDKRKQLGKTITFSKRLNLNLPHNYYPGVGTYEIKRYLQQYDNLIKRRALTARNTTRK